MVIAHTATARIQAAFPAQDHQKHGPGNCLPLCHPKSQKNHGNVSKVGPRGLPKYTLKSIKMDTWTSRCLLGVPVDPWITKMVTQGTKMEPQGLQNNSFGYKQ